MGCDGNDRPYPTPFQGVGESGRPCRAWNAEIANSNLATLTIQQQR